MDAGAHFFRADLQVHTPRDRNWNGTAPTDPEGRRTYAEEFVRACRRKGLQAVAITDHHDVAFCPFIRSAAQDERDASGSPISEHERLVVFPGMELTLAIPCQALLIFDSELPNESLSFALTALGITPSSLEEAHHGEITKLDFMNFDDLYATLNRLEPLRDRFIVFPHMGDGGYKTLLRKDFEKHYKTMPCVGGYVDGDLPVPPRSAGMRSITDGLDQNWGNKAIGLFQTSDSRSEDFSTLGQHSTWIKWAQPTAEALRQACLARHSRISQSEPAMPGIWITRIEVSNSRFLGPVTLDLNPQYNAVIGGRGTGKSSLLEYLRWALCDQPPATTSDSTQSAGDYEVRRQSLIGGTLAPLDASVDVAFVLNGVNHAVRRKVDGSIALQIGAGPFQKCSEGDIRELLPIQAYSQKQLSAVGARLDELRRFVQSPIQEQLEAHEGQATELAGQIRSAFARLVEYKRLQADLESHKLEQRSLAEQVEVMRAALKGLTPEDEATIAAEAGYGREQRWVESLERDLKVAEAALQEASSKLGHLPSNSGTGAERNQALLSQLQTSLTNWVKSARDAVDGLLQSLGKVATPSEGSVITQWRELREQQTRQYEAAKKRAATQQDKLVQIQAIEERLAEQTRSADEKAHKLAGLGDPMSEFADLRGRLLVVRTARADLLDEQCANLARGSNSRLRASLKRAADIAPLTEELRRVAKGTNIRKPKVEGLAAYIKSSDTPLATWHEILTELQELAWIEVKDTETIQLPPTPLLDNAGLVHKEKVALSSALQPDDWLKLLLFDLRDMPVFEYEIRTSDYIPFEKASPGQQATALLSILLLQEGPPLVIDQPEDDLNMKIINDIVHLLWKAKSRRQVIFSSHNANLVVNGDAELVICCDYRTTATESGGHIKSVGAIDMPMINREIAEVMEGGIEAFQLRQKKYGF